MSSEADRDALNQTPPWGDIDLWRGDTALTDAAGTFGRPSAGEGRALEEFGRRWGSAGMAELGRLANANPPQLRIFDPRGFRLDRVDFHPAYHALMRESVSEGLHASTWDGDGDGSGGGGANAHVLRAARLHMAGEVEAGHLCPIVMTHAAAAALAAEPALLSAWLPRIRARDYDPEFRPAEAKRGVTLGMGMTERQGGTDVRANATRAVRDGDAYRISGHKWFLSAPMSDAFLVLAQAEGGLTCFLMPRFRPDGSVNALHFDRLKDKLGNRSNASSEVRFEDAFAWRCGGEGEGIRTIIAMVQLTRLDCVVASAGLMRGALAFAIHHARHRSVFQKKLADRPLMRSVIGDLALEREGAVALAMRLAAAFDRAGADADERAFARIVTPAAKLWICKAAPGFVYETMECLGGNGYVEDWPLARAYREAPVNAIWEGSGNVMALDLLRSAEREVEAMERVVAMLARQTKGLPGAGPAIERVRASLKDPEREANGRRTAEALALLAAAAALVQCAPPDIAAAFSVGRLGGIGGRSYGDALPRNLTDTLIARSLV